MRTTKNGIIHFGFGVFLLILIVVYVVTAINSPETAMEVNSALKNLSDSVSGLIPFT